MLPLPLWKLHSWGSTKCCTQSDAAPCINILGVAKCADEVGDGLLHADPVGLVEPLARRDAELDQVGDPRRDVVRLVDVHELPRPVAQDLQPRPVPREGHVRRWRRRRRRLALFGLEGLDELSLHPHLLLPQARQSLQPPLDPVRVEFKDQFKIILGYLLLYTYCKFLFFQTKLVSSYSTLTIG